MSRKGMTYKGTNCRKNANWGNGKSMYSMIFSTASDLIYDLTHHEIVTFLMQSFLIKNHHFLLENFIVLCLVAQKMDERKKIENISWHGTAVDEFPCILLFPCHLCSQTEHQGKCTA